MCQTHRFQFCRDVDMSEAEATLRLSLLAAEGLYGEARVRTEVSYSLEPLRSEIRVDGSAPVGDAVAQIYASLLSHEFGRGAFTVRKEPAPEPVAASAA
ncbi:MAG: hypothetical protein HBSAPP03_23450 [Phycisphaerae bacterium]|nr:MAG: hypothetical protein HBSAPP03_23450 [Phycisphaerae bacterium]